MEGNAHNRGGANRVKVEMPISYRPAIVLIFLFVSLTICVHTPRVVADEKDPTTTIPWLVDGKTTREEVMQNFRKVESVQPLRTLSQGKILIYAINFDKQNGEFACPTKCEYYWKDCEPRLTECDYQLVLVFDKNNVVKRHSILKIYR
jgi:hypothetical protein